MKMHSKISIDYCYQNWGKTEKIVCEQVGTDQHVFLLTKDGQRVGTIFKTENQWQAGISAIFLQDEIAKIGRFIDRHLQERIGKANKDSSVSHLTHR